VSSRLRAQLRATPIVAPLPLSHVLHPGFPTQPSRMSRAPQLSQRRARSCRACFFSGFNATALLDSSSNGLRDRSHVGRLGPLRRCSNETRTSSARDLKPSRAVFAVVHEHFHRHGEIAITAESSRRQQADRPDETQRLRRLVEALPSM